MPKQLEFETSTELKRIFNAELEQWRRRHRLSLEELGKRCGVSSAYLAHIGRYGRIPGRPVLLLLALNFEMHDPDSLLRAAKSTEPWPFETTMGLTPSQKSPQDGFLSVKLDMAGFVDAIKTVVRAELKPRSLRELLNGRPLRIGLNPTQKWLFERSTSGALDITRGLVPDLCQMLRISLQCGVETFAVDFNQHIDTLCRGEIDLFGPMMATPQSPLNIPFTNPVHRIGLSALMRKRPTTGLTSLAPPQGIVDLINGGYEIAVLRNSRAHLLASTRLNRSDDTLILCESDEEALDRLLLRGISRPAHLFLCNSLLARLTASEHPEDVDALFAERETLLDITDNSFAVRPDWPEVVPVLNDALRYILTTGGFSQRFEDLGTVAYPGLLEPVAY